MLLQNFGWFGVIFMEDYPAVLIYKPLTATDGKTVKFRAKVKLHDLKTSLK